ncbi:MAG: MarR family winged helix-turn-helix transcriptional regulator [Candidatus Gastranaerophilaceae bacterium]
MENNYYIHSLLFELDQTSRLAKAYCSKHFDSEFSKKLSFDEFFILDMILHNPDIHQSNLAKKLLKGRSHTSKYLIAMEKKGYIERPVVIKNHKSVRILKITEKGNEVYQESNKIAQKFINDIDAMINKKDIDFIRNSLKQVKETILKLDNISFD